MIHATLGDARRRRRGDQHQVDDRAPARRRRRPRGDRHRPGAPPPGQSRRRSTSTTRTRGRARHRRRKPRDLPAGDIAALNNSFGFGGPNVAVAFGSVSMTDRTGHRRHQARRRAAAHRGPAQPAAPARPRCSTRARCELITPEDDCGMLAAVGRVDGTPRGGLLLRRDRHGRRDGRRGLQGRRRRLRPGADRRAPRSSASGTPAAPGCAEGVLSLHAVGRIFHAMTQASGKIPQISVVLGPAAGGAAYGPALTDVVILGPEGRIFVTGPDVVRSVTGEDVDMLRLGGPEPHGRRSGVVHILTETEQEALDEARAPSPRCSARRAARRRRRSRTATSSQLLPESKKRAYDVHPLVDGRARRRHRCSSCTPTLGAQHRHRARPLRRPHRRRHRQQPAAARRLPRLAVGGEGRRASCGCATRSACRWSSLVDVPGYLPGVGQEWDGVVRRGAKLLHAFGEAWCRG